jgi:hypothetical protein
VPCKHKVCFGCVENMRAKNIFKVGRQGKQHGGLVVLCALRSQGR